MRCILDLTACEPAYGLAVDEALLRQSSAGAIPVFRAWINRRAVVFGRSQIAAEEADLDACRRLGIPVLRRISGGGAVVHHPGNLNLTLIVPGRDRLGAVLDTFEFLGSIVATVLTLLGVPIISRGNALMTHEGRKLGGAAQARRHAVLWHTTLLLHADTIPMEALLRALRPDYHPSRVASRPSPTTTLAELSEEPVAAQRLASEVAAAFAVALHERHTPSALTAEEEALAYASAATGEAPP